MARPIEEINQQIVDMLVANFAAQGIVIDPAQWSKRNHLRLICWTQAQAQNYMEQLQDLFISQVEDIQRISAAASPAWLQDAMFRFQYDATTPQVLDIIPTTLTLNGVNYTFLLTEYPVVDPTLRIVTACSVKSTASGQVKIKIATGNPLAALSAPQLAAAQSYINMKGTAGITYVASSAIADRLFIGATIWYQGSYSAVIQTNIIAALNDFLQNLSLTDFDGSIKVSDIEGVIRAVPGVNDVTLNDVAARANSTAFGSGSNLVVANQTLARLYNTFAGYIIQEDTAGETFADSLILIAQ